MISFYGLTRDELARQVGLPGIASGAVACQLYRAVYRRGARSWSEVGMLPTTVRRQLQQNVSLDPLRLAHQAGSSDGSRKLVFALDEAVSVEGVIIPRRLPRRSLKKLARFGLRRVRGAPLGRILRNVSGRELALQAHERLTRSGALGMTGCISTQAGCAMGCRFCHTGVDGRGRNLQPHEIVGQVMAMRAVVPITNLVFMGMGEPLLNLDNVVAACRILQDIWGLGYVSQRIIVSTCGVVPAIDELSGLLDVRLAISLNASSDEVRSELMPCNRKWKIDAVLRAAERYVKRARGPVMLEYVLLAGVNDSVRDADRLARLVRGIDAGVSLIPHNEFPGSPYRRPSGAAVADFARQLRQRGVAAIVRLSGGGDILAACGQLSSRYDSRSGGASSCGSQILGPLRNH